MRCLALLTACILLSTVCVGCRTGGKVKLASGAAITPPSQAEQPTQVSESKQQSAMALPAGSTIQVTTTPETAQSPAVTSTLYTLAKDTQQTVQSSSQTISLSPTRKPDTTVALHKIDVAERRWLLFIGIGLGVAGIAVKSLLPAWPGLPRGLFLGAAIALASWKLAEIPAWIWLLAVGVSALLALGYKRGEVDEKKST